MTVVAPDVSVIIPTYNAEGFVERALSTATSQLGVTLEAVVVDDASTDSTASVVARLSAADPRIRLVRNESNAGPAAARNAGIAAARGRWIALLDADDAYLPGRLSHLVVTAEEAGADVVADRFLYYDPRSHDVHAAGFRGRGVRRVDLHDYLREARPGRLEPDLGLLKPVFRAAFLAERGLAYPEHSRHGEDFLFMVDVLASGATFLIGAGTGYLYTERTAGWSRTTVDYEAMAAQSERLLNTDALAGDAEARRLLRGRVQAVRGYHSLVEIRSAVGGGGVAALVPELRARPRAVLRGGAFYVSTQRNNRVVRRLRRALPTRRGPV